MSRGKEKRALIFCFIESILLIAIDQLLKYWVVLKLKPIGEKQIWNIGNTEILGLRFLENNGAAFSSFAGMQWLLIAATTIMIIGCCIWLVRSCQTSKLLATSLSMIIAGGLGNLIDRIFRGGLVVDYIEIRLFRFAVFNFADCCVVIGVCLIILYLFFIEPKKEKQKIEQEHLDA